MNIVPLDHLWVEANLWENRLESIRPGQKAEIIVDLYGSKRTYHGVVEGVVPGSGSVFATLPPDNATGNFIRIVQRIPVRIAIDPEELKKQPLRPGLSTITTIDVNSTPVSPNDSIVKTATSEYTTEVFDKDLAEARARAEAVIKNNLLGAPDAAESCVVAEEMSRGGAALCVKRTRLGFRSDRCFAGVGAS
jgi:membrane fusion protein (multidrug efflux system)